MRKTILILAMQATVIFLVGCSKSDHEICVDKVSKDMIKDGVKKTAAKRFAAITCRNRQSG